MTTINLPLQSATGPAHVVKAEIVDVAPHLAHVATFAVHQIPKGTWARDLYDYLYRISNVETGACISACDSKTRAGCIKVARSYLADKTEDEMQEAMERTIKEIK